jgi:spore germination cell wall hydrolase CwlJ-like protein/phage terminase small subunit|tara:strand:- start:12779 stop:16366 length:3588 start_codon:yes stop_codon:yes gene_type:complete
MKDLTDPTNRDSVPAMLTPGEWVINKEASQMFGPQLQAMNDAGLEQRAAENKMVKGDVPKYNAGGNIPYLTANDGKYVLSEDDKDYLIRMAAAEARGESDEGQAAVIFAALNRQKANINEFGGNKIKDIIYHPNAFSSVTDKANKHWYSDKKMNKSKEYARSKSILEGIIKGDIEDPTGGAEHFLNESVVRESREKGDLPPWWNNTHNRKQIGKHTFSLNNRVHDFNPELTKSSHIEHLNSRRDDSLPELFVPEVIESIIPKVRTLDVPTSNAEDHMNNIMKSTRDSVENSSLNVPAMEDTPMYANTGASSIQTLIQGLLKGNNSSGFAKHKVNQLGRDQMTDEAMLYGSSQARNNVLGGPGDPYGRQLQSYPPMTNAHGFPYHTEDATFSVPKVEETPEKRDLWEFYNGKNDIPIQQNIETNERSLIPKVTTRVMPSGGDSNTRITVGTGDLQDNHFPLGTLTGEEAKEKEDSYWGPDFFKPYWDAGNKKIEVSPPDWLGGGDMLGIAPPETDPEKLAIIRNAFIDPNAPDYIKPEKNEVVSGGFAGGVKTTPIKTHDDFLRAEEKYHESLVAKMDALPEGTNYEEVVKLQEEIDKSAKRITTSQNLNTVDIIKAKKLNQKEIDKAEAEKQRLLKSGKFGTDPVIKRIDDYIERVKARTAYIPDAWSTSNKKLWENAENPPIHGSAGDIQNRIANLTAQTGDDDYRTPGTEEERVAEFGDDPFAGKAASVMAEIEASKDKKTGKFSPMFSKMLSSAQDLIKEAFDDVFDGKSLARAAMIYSAYRLTGATGNQALKAAGSDYMEQVEYVNKAELWGNHIKKLSNYNVFTKPSLELYAKTQDTADLVRFSDLTDLIGGTLTKEVWNRNQNGGWTKYAAQDYEQGKKKGWATTINGVLTPIDLTSNEWTDSAVTARDFEHNDFLTIQAAKERDMAITVKDELLKDNYLMDKETKKDGKMSTSRVSLFPNLSQSTEAKALAKFGWAYGLSPDKVIKIYEIAVANAAAFHRSTKRDVPQIAGYGVDSAFMNAAWIQVEAGDASLFEITKGKPSKPNKWLGVMGSEEVLPTYDSPNDITNTLERFQKMTVNGNPVHKRLHSADLSVFSSQLLESIKSVEARAEGDSGDMDILPNWNDWRSTFVDKSSREYQGSDKKNSSPLAKNIEDWRDSKGSTYHAGKSEFLKFIEFYMYSFKTLNSK